MARSLLEALEPQGKHHVHRFQEWQRHAKDRDDEIAILERSFQREIRARLLKRKIQSGPKGLKPGALITEEILENLTLGQQLQITIWNDKVMGEI